MKYLVVGASGLLGRYLVDALKRQNCLAPAKSELNICQAQQTADYIQKHCPSHIIHAAAWTNVEACEEDPKLCNEINYVGTQNLVKPAKEIGANFVYISSTGIYGDTSKLPHNEEEKPNPTTEHHNAKYKSELYISQHLQDFLIIRTGWLFGGYNKERNFVWNRILEAQKNEAVKSNNEQVGCPSYAHDIAQHINEMLDQNMKGIYNLVNSGSASRSDYIQTIYNHYGLATKVIGVANSHFNRKANVAMNETASLTKLNAQGIYPRNWSDALKDYIKELKSSDCS